MASTGKKRPKFEPKSPATKPHHHALFMEPSPNFFPSKRDLLRLLAVVAIAASVAIACNHATLTGIMMVFVDKNFIFLVYLLLTTMFAVVHLLV
ncbi:hypothetical protein RJ640_016964 [Escallonia rubra]|uniref:Uncharacterized protein n=1 Tax=Escallonia rubra TaxID=112253 RepID=A0AA88RGD0_9ASTE|nr:hypothetical protein RJ640_016964 [Escallonia rubra]